MGLEFAAEAGRLDAVVAARLGIPRADVQRAIVAGRVSVDGQARPKSFRLTGGETVRADVPTDEEVQPESGGVPVRYRDEHLLVVAKPAGWACHSRRWGVRCAGASCTGSTRGPPA